MTNVQLSLVIGGVVGAVSRDLGSYIIDRRKWINARAENAIDLPPKPIFDIPLFLGSAVLGALSGLSAAGIVQVAA